MSQRVTTYCRICEAACGLEVDTDGERPKIRPDRAHPISKGFVCAKGTRFAEVAFHPERLLEPQVRSGGALRAVSWETALAEVRARILPIIERHGPHAVGLYVGNPLAFDAFGQLASLFLGRALGTRNVFTAGSQDCNNKFAAASILHGSPAIHPVPDLEQAELAVLFGTNPAVSQSSFRAPRGRRVDLRSHAGARRAHRLGGRAPDRERAPLGRARHRAARHRRVAHPRAARPLRRSRPARRARGGLDRLLSLARDVTPERAARVTGVDARAIRDLAHAIGSVRTALHMSVGVNQGPFGTLSYVALQALAFVTGNYDRRGGSLFSPHGVYAARLTRMAGIFTSTATSRIGGFPTVFDSLPGGVLADEILTEGAERVRALVVVAGDPLRSVPGAGRLAEAFDRLDALVCVDLFESLTGQRADVLLPSTSWLERADFALPGLPLQTVDLLQTSGAVMEPVGESRHDHQILAELSLALDRPLFGRPALARWLARAELDRAVPALTELAWRLFDRRPERRGYGIRVGAPKPGTFLGRGPMTPGRRVRFWDARLEGERARLEQHERAREASEGFVLIGRRRRIGPQQLAARRDARRPARGRGVAPPERHGGARGGGRRRRRAADGGGAPLDAGAREGGRRARHRGRSARRARGERERAHPERRRAHRAPERHVHHDGRARGGAARRARRSERLELGAQLVVRGDDVPLAEREQVDARLRDQALERVRARLERPAREGRSVDAGEAHVHAHARVGEELLDRRSDERRVRAGARGHDVDEVVAAPAREGHAQAEQPRLLDAHPDHVPRQARARAVGRRLIEPEEGVLARRSELEERRPERVAAIDPELGRHRGARQHARDGPGRQRLALGEDEEERREAGVDVGLRPERVHRVHQLRRVDGDGVAVLVAQPAGPVGEVPQHPEDRGLRVEAVGRVARIAALEVDGVGGPERSLAARRRSAPRRARRPRTRWRAPPPRRAPDRRPPACRARPRRCRSCRSGGRRSARPRAGPRSRRRRRRCPGGSGSGDRRSRARAGSGEYDETSSSPRTQRAKSGGNARPLQRRAASRPSIMASSAAKGASRRPRRRSRGPSRSGRRAAPCGCGAAAARGRRW
ncbi:MAG: molybdopterin-dependent oxidoreductase [Sandaracinaceae bacterium]|nr:molybdopterin-dependent oxidoreductase [Sandaracinaceae bacterium]